MQLSSIINRAILLIASVFILSLLSIGTGPRLARRATPPPVDPGGKPIAESSGQTQRLTSADQTPEGLSKGDWSGIREAYEAGRRKVFERAPGAWTARNPHQQMAAEFDGRGATLTTDGGTRLGLKLAGYGFSDKTTSVGAKARQVKTTENRIAYEWDERLTEWFVNDERGFEQGWTLASAPSGATSIRIDVAVTGGLRAKAADATTVKLTDGTGAVALSYAGLKAWDATGKMLAARFDVENGNRIGVTVETAGAVYPVTVDPWVQQAYLKASNTETFDGFGHSVAVAGDTVVVGATFEDSAATGIDGNGANNSAGNSGAAYVFVRSGGVWSQQAYLKASNTNPGDNFGYSVAVAGDTVVVGAFGEDSAATGVNGNQADNSANVSGAAYVFVRSGTTWSQQAYLKASNTDALDAFGGSVAVAGNTVVIGAPNEDSAATGVNGNQADNSATDSGAAYVFVRSGGVWSQQAYLKTSNTDEDDNFGWSVAVAGDTVVVGARYEDSAATGVNGNQADNSAFNAGAAYVFVRSGGVWSQQAYLKASNTSGNDIFSASVAVAGDTVVVGAPGEDSNATGVNGNQADNSAEGSGAAYVFVRSGTTWSQQAYLKASNTGAGDQFGWSVAVAGDTVVIGAYWEDSAATGVNGNQADNSASFSGAAYVFVRSGGVWSQQAYLKASNTDEDDNFGTSVAVSGDTVVIGAEIESSAATGVNGNQADNSAGASGAAYVFILGESVLSIDRAGANLTCTGGTVAWTVTFSGPVAGLTAANFSLVPSGVTGATITGVTGGPTVWTVTATTGTGSGSLGLNLANATGVTPQIAILPFTGQVYTVAALPTVFNVTGGGAYCASGSGVSVGLSDSQAGVNYQLFNGMTTVGGPVAGTGAALSFGNQTATGTYTVVATNATTTCTASMTGSAVVTVNPAPTVSITVVESSGTTPNDGIICAGASVTLTASGGTSYSWSTGASTASITVIPATTTTYTVTATNASGCQTVVMRTITVNPPPPAPTITPGGPTTFCIGGSVMLVSSSASGNQWFLGGNPIGGATGQSITATAGGAYTVVVTTAGCASAASAPTTVTVAQVPTVTPASLPGGMVGMAYNQLISTTGGTGPDTFAVTAGTLPLGLSLSPAGVLSGMPLQAGTFPFTVTATGICVGSRAYTLVIECPPITVNPASLPGGTAAVAYSQTITATGTLGAPAFTVSTGTLPAGLTLTTAGVLSGTPTVIGTFNFTIRATDTNPGTSACFGERPYSLVLTCPTITVSPVTLPAAIVGVAYSQTVTAAGGIAPYTFAVTAGALPPGLTLDGTTGAVTGTPTTVDTFNFTITATDANKCTGTRSYTVQVRGVELSLLYVADTDNSRIQVFDGSTWTLAPRSSGVVGSAAGQFRSPEGVAATRTNQIYVADTGNNRIHWYNGFTWSDFATIGSALNQVRAPQAVAIDVTGQFLFVADTGNNRVLRFNANAPNSAGVVLANTGGLAGQVNGPRGLAVDNLGNLFIADTGNSRILRIANATGVATADTGAVVATGFRAPEGVALDNDGNLYIADTGNSRIMQLPGGASGTPVTLATLGTALGSVRSAEGLTVTNFASGPLAGRMLLVGDTANSRVQARPLAGGAWSIVGGTGSGLGQFRSPSKVR